MGNEEKEIMKKVTITHLNGKYQTFENCTEIQNDNRFLKLKGIHDGNVVQRWFCVDEILEVYVFE